MKSIAIMGSENDINFESIVSAGINTGGLNITCISDKKNSALLKKAEQLNIKNFYLPSEEIIDYFKNNKFDLVVLDEYFGILPKEVFEHNKFINIQPSLLPSFRGEDAIKQAYLEGIKVTGISIYWVSEDANNEKIITQVPVIVENLMHYDELDEKIHLVEQQFYPVVIESILNDKVFDFTDFIKKSKNNSCGGGCSSCGGCGGS